MRGADSILIDRQAIHLFTRLLVVREILLSLLRSERRGSMFCTVMEAQNGSTYRDVDRVTIGVGANHTTARKPDAL